MDNRAVRVLRLMMGFGTRFIQIYGNLVYVLDTGFWILDAGYWMLDSRCWILDYGLSEEGETPKTKKTTRFAGGLASDPPEASLNFASLHSGQASRLGNGFNKKTTRFAGGLASDPPEARTRDPRLKRPLLYQLS